MGEFLRESLPALDGLVDNPDLLPRLELVLGHHVLVVNAVITFSRKPARKKIFTITPEAGWRSNMWVWLQSGVN